ncbi:MAG TPA: hypothetical protein VG425_02790 [Casimicrobiaceae bacterium]|jgi:hypothetical protein|nr:hypothetical protein [Casimicrobiaceae bacterium]
MKYVLIPILAALLGGCALAPSANDDAERGYNRGDGNYLYRNYNDGYYHKFSYRGEHGDQEDPAGTVS